MSSRRRKPTAKAPEPRGELQPREQTYTEWDAALPDHERRIEEIMHKMLSGAWLSGVSDRALAQQWNVQPNTVRRWAAEASRLVRFRLRDDPDAKKEARALLLQTFQVISAKAMAKGDAPSLRVALDAMRAYGFYYGIEPAKRLDVTERQDPFEGWSTQEKLAYANDGSKPRRALAAMAAANGTDDGADAADEDSLH